MSIGFNAEQDFRSGRSEKESQWGQELVIPEKIGTQLRENTQKFIDSLFERRGQGESIRPKQGAPSVVAVMERSGTIAAAGVVDWFSHHKITDPKLITLSHMGHELEEECGSIFVDEAPEVTVQQDIDNFQDRLRDLADTDHPFAGQINKLSQVLRNLPAGKVHEVQVLDDYIGHGGVSEVIMPVVVELAGKRAGYQNEEIDAVWPNVEDLVQRHFIDDESYENQWQREAVGKVGKGIRYRPEHTIVMVPDSPHWLDEIIGASFGDDLSLLQAGTLNEAMRGSSDFSRSNLNTPGSMALSRGIGARGFDPQKDGAAINGGFDQEIGNFMYKKGISVERKDFLDSLRNRLESAIKDLIVDRE